ncbi:hypothetical protein BH23ACT3_BH23ACT3_13630 [soil metagenome]
MGITGENTSHPFRLAAVALTAVALLGACTAGDDHAATSRFEAPSIADEPADMELAGDDDAADSADRADSADSADSADTAEPGAARSGGSGGVGGFDLGEIGRQVAVEMRITMRTGDLRAAVDGILAAASAGGGGVAATDVDYGTDTRDGRATVVVKVPPRALNALLSGLDDLGEVTNIGQDALDVTDQLTDLDVRIRNAEQSVDRVRGLLAEATDLREVIDLESELTRRQTDLERLQATERNLEERVSFATVTIQVFPTSAAVAEADPETDPGIADGFRTGWDAFVGVLFGLTYGLAVIAPVLAVTLLVLLIGWRVLARQRRRAGIEHHRPAPPVDDDAADTELADTGLSDTGLSDAGLSDAATASRRP